MTSSKQLLRGLEIYLRACYHEAGHAVVAHAVGRHLGRISVARDEDLTLGRTGFTMYRGVRLTERSRPDTIRRSLVVALSGAIAERTHAPGSRDCGDRQDREEAAEYAFGYGRACRSRAWDAISELAAAESRAKEMVSEHWSTIEAVASTLLEHEGVLRGESLRQVLGARPEKPCWGRAPTLQSVPLVNAIVRRYGRVA
jgi:hypothetical protein